MIYHFKNTLLAGIVSFMMIQGSVTVNATETNAPAYQSDAASEYNEQLALESNSAVLIDAKTGIVIYDKNMEAKSHPASTTKIMTVLLLLENAGGDLTVRIPFSHEAVFNLEKGSSHIAMDEGETLSIEECLYAMLLPSANEVCNAVAEYLGGSIDGFAVMMTERAKELGALNTHFSNANGLYSENHYTTAYDMALIMREAIKYEEFVKIIGTQRYDIPPTEKQPEVRIIYNSNKQIFEGNKYYNPDVVGSKTGYTDLSRHTLVSYGKRDNKDIIAVIMQAEKNIPYTDTKLLLDYGFTHFRDVKVFDASMFSDKVNLTQSYKGSQSVIGSVAVCAEGGLSLSLPDNVIISNIEQIVNLPDSIPAPAKKGVEVGTLDFVYEGAIFGSVALRLAEEGAALEESEILAMFPDKAVDDSMPTNGSAKEKSGISLFKILSLVGIVLVGGFFVLCYLNYMEAQRKKRRRTTMRRTGEVRTPVKNTSRANAPTRETNRNYRYR